MHEFANERIEGDVRQKVLVSAICWTLISGSVLVVLVILLSVHAGSRRNSIVPQFVGEWTLTFADGTNQQVAFNPDGTVLANDNVVYRWSGTSAEICIDTYEHAAIDLSQPRTFVKYLFPDRGQVVLRPEYSDDGIDYTLVGDAVRLRRQAPNANPGVR